MSIKHPRHWARQTRFNTLDRLPRQSGIYAVMCGRQALYIGRSNNLYRRWNSDGGYRHHRYWLALLRGTHLKYLVIDRHKEAEEYCLDQYYTPWNGTDVPWFFKAVAFWGYVGAIGWLLWAKRKSKGSLGKWGDRVKVGIVLLGVVLLGV